MSHRELEEYERADRLTAEHKARLCAALRQAWAEHDTTLEQLADARKIIDGMRV